MKTAALMRAAVLRGQRRVLVHAYGGESWLPMMPSAPDAPIALVSVPTVPWVTNVGRVYGFFMALSFSRRTPLDHLALARPL